MNAASGTVAVVIPNWNRADLVGEVLKHLRAQNYPIQEICVVDNGSTDASATVAQDAGARVVHMGRNAGFAAAVNRGIANTRSEWVAVINNDVSFGPEWLGTLIAEGGARGANFAVGKLLNAADPKLIDGTFDAVSRGGMPWRCGSGRRDGPEWNEPRCIQFAPMTAALFRRSVFETVGLLDERFESHLEDVEFGLRCAAAGLTGVYVPGATGFHMGSATLGAWHNATVRRIGRNHILLVAKYFSNGPRWPALVGHVLWMLLACTRRAGWASVRGTIDGLLARRDIVQKSAWGEVRQAVEAGEREIRQIQRRTGFDLYWRVYFSLVRS
jgi:GT2 family glycosyltransferase